MRIKKGLIQEGGKKSPKLINSNYKPNQIFKQDYIYILYTL